MLLGFHERTDRGAMRTRSGPRSPPAGPPLAESARCEGSGSGRPDGTRAAPLPLSGGSGRSNLAAPGLAPLTNPTAQENVGARRVSVQWHLATSGAAGESPLELQPSGW